MTTSVALLSGVNAGSGNRVAMADLRAMLGAAGFGNVRTHLASGNVVLDAKRAGHSLTVELQHLLARELRLKANVIVRSPGELDAAIASDPFGDEAPNGSRHVLGFLAARPDPDRVADVEARIAASPSDGDRHAFAERHFYLWCPNGISASPYFKTPWKRLGVASTQRNWNTVTALARMAAA